MHINLHDRTLQSSLNDLPVETRWTFITCCLMSDWYGDFTSTPAGIARAGNLPIDAVRAALETLQAPDPDTTTPDDDGRRVISLGNNKWHVVNVLKYRLNGDMDKVREQNRSRQRRYREKQADSNVTVTLHDVTVTGGNAPSRHIDIDKDEDQDRSVEQKNNAHEAPDAGTGPASPRSAGNKGEPKEKKERTATPKAAINHSITFDPATFTLHGITDADRAQWQGYAPGVDVDTEIDAFLDYMQTHPEALQRTLKTGAWKAAINTRFRNAAKYGVTMTKAKRPDAERDPLAGKSGNVGQPPKPKPLAIKPSSEFDWPATKKILESTLEPDLYARWIEPLTYEGMSERGAVLAAADQYAANYVWYNLRDHLGDAILVAHGLAVRFCCLSRSGLAGAGS